MEKFESKFNKDKTKISEKEIECNKYFEALQPATFALVKKMKEKIDKGEYDMLIGDDASARVPTLVLRGIINARKRKLHPELQGKDSEIRTRFVAGGHDQGRSELEPAFERIKKEGLKKALIVTEFVSSGESVKLMSDILDDLNIDFDVATFSSEKINLNFPKKKHDFIYGELTSPDEENDPPEFYCVPEVNGVVKDFHSKSYAIPFVKDMDDKDKENTQNIINLARKKVDLLVEKTIKEVWNE